MKKIIWVTVLVLIFIAGNVNAQKKSSNKTSKEAQKENPLKGLKKAGPNDINPDKPIMLDPMVTPMYYENLAKVKPEEFMKAMMSGDYVPEPYLNTKGDIKVIILRKASEEEKRQMLEMQQNEMEPQKNDLLGQEAAKFSVIDIYGKAFSLEELKGKVIVLNFWFVECKPCVSEIPELNKLVEKYKGKEVVFIGFASNDKEKLMKFLNSNSFTYNIIPNTPEISDNYGVKGFPTHVIIDKDSIIRHHSLGPTTMSNLEKSIEKLLK